MLIITLILNCSYFEFCEIFCEQSYSIPDKQENFCCLLNNIQNKLPPHSPAKNRNDHVEKESICPVDFQLMLRIRILRLEGKKKEKKKNSEAG